MKKVRKENQKGKLIVIEGTDGSGKATQTKLLEERLRREGFYVEVADFPQYGQVSASFVEKYLRGEYGSAEEVGPYRASLFFALDRYEKSHELRRWLTEGAIVICNRYTSANMGHQAGKICDRAERLQFIDWLEELEYKLLNIPKPDLTILLFMPPEAGQQLVDKKKARFYTKGKSRDIHEADLRHLQAASRAYREVAREKGWYVIDCAPKSLVLPIERVHEEVVKEVSCFLSKK